MVLHTRGRVGSRRFFWKPSREISEAFFVYGAMGAMGMMGGMGVMSKKRRKSSLIVWREKEKNIPLLSVN